MLAKSETQYQVYRGREQIKPLKRNLQAGREAKALVSKGWALRPQIAGQER